MDLTLDPTPPTSGQEAMDAWLDSMAYAWVYFRDTEGVSYGSGLINPDESAIQKSRKPGSSDRAAVSLVDMKLAVSRVVDRTREATKESWFRAWILRRAIQSTYAELSQMFALDESTIRYWVTQVDALAVTLGRGEYLVVGDVLDDGERWTWIPNMDRRYAVTSEGRIISLVDGTPRVLTVGKDGRVALKRGDTGRIYRPRVARLVKEAFGQGD